MGLKGLAKIVTPFVVAGLLGGCASTGRGNYTNFNSNEPAMSTIYKRSHLARDIMDKTKFLWSDKVKQDMEEYQERGNKGSLPENVYRDNRGVYHPIEGYGWINSSNPNDLRVAPINELMN